MSTEALVDELVQRFNGWNRSGDHGVLRYLNTAHAILMSQEAQQNLIFDESTGRLPLLETTSGVFTYTMASTVWRVSGILIDNDRDIVQRSDYNFEPDLRTSQKNSIVIGGRYYTKIPFIRTWDYINSSTPAKVMFTADPETKSDYYYVRSYKRPTEITSELIQPDIATPWDFDILLPAAAKLIEGVQNGNYDEARRIVRRELAPLLWDELDSGDQGYLDTEPVDRGF